MKLTPRGVTIEGKAALDMSDVDPPVGLSATLATFGNKSLEVAVDPTLTVKVDKDEGPKVSVDLSPDIRIKRT